MPCSDTIKIHPLQGRPQSVDHIEKRTAKLRGVSYPERNKKASLYFAINAPNLIGEKFGKLTVIRQLPALKNRTMWLCECDCGGTKSVPTHRLVGLVTKSCGCIRASDMASDYKRRSTLRSQSSEYKIWAGIRQRCHNPKSFSYKSYGGRGISVCDEWRNSFDQFLLDMGRRPSNDYSLERLNNNGGYSKENCKWATRSEQQANRRVSVLLSAYGITACQQKWSRILGVTAQSIASYIKNHSTRSLEGYINERPAMLARLRVTSAG